MGITQKSKWTQWRELLNGRNELIGFYRTNGKKVQVRAMNDDIRGEATCNKCDKFDLYVGINIAFLRMRKKVVDRIRIDCNKVIKDCNNEELVIKHKIKNIINSVNTVEKADE